MIVWRIHPGIALLIFVSVINQETAEKTTAHPTARVNAVLTGVPVIVPEDAKETHARLILRDIAPQTIAPVTLLIPETMIPAQQIHPAPALPQMSV